MKTISKLILAIVFIASSVCFMSCEDDREMLDLNNPADILEFNINNRIGLIDQENQTIMISMPAGSDDLSALTPSINVSGGAEVSPASGEPRNFSSPVQYLVTSGGVYKKYTVTVNVLDAGILGVRIDEFEGTINEESNEIIISLPYGTDFSNLAPEFTLTEEASVSPASGEVQDFTIPVTYTLTSGSITKEYTVRAVVKVAPDMSRGPIGTEKAFLGTGADRNSLPDDDEQAAADWFFSEYPDANYISWDQVSGGAVNIYDYNVIWWQYDNASQLPEQAVHPEVSNLFSNYLKDGGNLFFSGHACKYFWNIGRISTDFNMAVGDGDGFENGDTWTIGVNLPAKDHRGHPLYKNIFFDEADGFYTFPIIGPGWREDHNHVIVEVARHYGYPNHDILAYASFVQDLDAEWLGVWGGIRDYYMAGVLELKPNDVFNGRAIYMGIGGFEWNQNAQGGINPEGINLYQNNIIQISKNAIEYLSGI